MGFKKRQQIIIAHLKRICFIFWTSCFKEFRSLIELEINSQMVDNIIFGFYKFLIEFIRKCSKCSLKWFFFFQNSFLEFIDFHRILYLYTPFHAIYCTSWRHCNFVDWWYLSSMNCIFIALIALPLSLIMISRYGNIIRDIHNNT